MTGRYWQEAGQRRVSRRRLLAGAAALAAGGVGLSVVGCRRQEEEWEEAVPPGTPAALEAVGTRGGMFRGFGYDPVTLDTYDPHQTQFGPIYNMHSSVFSKVLNYEDEVQGIMYPDLSAGPDGGPGMPEQVDEITYIVRIRPNVRFQDTPWMRKDFPAVAGRQLTAGDVKYSIERQINPDSPQRALYYRSGLWGVVDRIDLVDDLTLRIATKEPIAPFVSYFADRNAAIIARELVDENDEMNDAARMIGSGPFILDEFRPLERARYLRNPRWFAADDRPEIGTGRPFLDGYEIAWTPQSDVVAETAFRTKQVEDFSPEDLSSLYRVAEEVAGQAVISAIGIAGSPSSRMLLDRPPFQDFRVRKAWHLAVDRQLLGEALYPAPAGATGFRFNGPVHWPMTRWAIPQEELLRKSGYRFAPKEREEDLKEAKRLWEAAGGSEGLGRFKILFAGAPAYITSKALPQFVRMLRETLGVEIETEVDPTGYTTIAACLLRNSQGAAEGTCMMTWGFDNGWIDLDDWLYLYYKTGAPKNSFRLSDAKLDRLLDAQRAEFDFDKRRQIGLDVQHYLLDDLLPRLEYISQFSHSLDWKYVKNPHSWTWFGHAYWLANVWLDRDDPSFAGRPA